jgi:hypothetical protein
LLSFLTNVFSEVLYMNARICLGYVQYIPESKIP